MNNLLNAVDKLMDSNYLIEDNVLKVLGNYVIISGSNPVKTNKGEIRICTDKSLVDGIPELKLIGSDNMQPCIGPQTMTGLSYGRYSIANCKLKKIIIDGVKVICEPANKSFSIGTYGLEDLPEIELLNGGELICPEMNGRRVLQIPPDFRSDSTKLSRVCVYRIIDPNKDNESIIKEDQELYELFKEITSLRPDTSSLITIESDKNKIKEAISLLKMSSSLNVNCLLDKQYRNIPTYILAGCCVLGLSSNCYVKQDMFYEMARWPELHKRYLVNRDDIAEDENYYTNLSTNIVMSLLGSKHWMSLTDYEKRFVYELIPLYDFDFTGKSNVECAQEWWFEKCKLI